MVSNWLFPKTMSLIGNTELFDLCDIWPIRCLRKCLIPFNWFLLKKIPQMQTNPWPHLSLPWLIWLIFFLSFCTLSIHLYIKCIKYVYHIIRYLFTKNPWRMGERLRLKEQSSIIHLLSSTSQYVVKFGYWVPVSIVKANNNNHQDQISMLLSQ